MRRNIRVYKDSIRHAQAIGLARRIHSAAKLRPRHRAFLCFRGRKFCILVAQRANIN